jgi:hypothetical protein
MVAGLGCDLVGYLVGYLVGCLVGNLEGLTTSQNYGFCEQVSGATSRFRRYSGFMGDFAAA